MDRGSFRKGRNHKVDRECDAVPPHQIKQMATLKWVPTSLSFYLFLFLFIFIGMINETNGSTSEFVKSGLKTQRA